MYQIKFFILTQVCTLNPHKVITWTNGKFLSTGPSLTSLSELSLKIQSNSHMTDFI